MRKWFLIIVLFWLFGHFVMIVTYDLFPNNISQGYVYPLFHQYWRLFVPPPEGNYEVIKLTSEGKSVNVMEHCNSGVKRNLIFGNETKVLSMTNAIHVFERNALSRGFIHGNATGDENFAILRKIICNACIEDKKQQISRLILIIKPHMRNGAIRVYYSVEWAIFNVFIVNNLIFNQIMLSIQNLKL